MGSSSRGSYSLRNNNLNKKLSNRHMIDIALYDIIDLKNQIDAYEKHMTKESFEDSEEVEKLYEEIK